MRAPASIALSLFATCLLAMPSACQNGQAASDESMPAMGATTQVVMKTTLGDMTIELYVDKAPISVANFLTYAKDGFYTDTIFHRVLKGFMAQGGGVIEGYTPKPTRDQIPNEADNGLKNERLTLAMARQGGAHTASSQFFINDGNNTFLDHVSKQGGETYGYCVFGKVVDGLDTFEKIVNAEVKVDRRADGRQPAAALETITITGVEILDPKAADKAIAEGDAAREAWAAKDAADRAAAAEARIAAAKARVSAAKEALKAGIDYVAGKGLDVSNGQFSDTGLWTLDVIEGEGRTPTATETVKAHYTGWLPNGTKFDSSKDRGQPLSFNLQGVIRGWTEGVGGMKAGGTRYLVVPHELGYGERGSPPDIPARATLVFEVELLSIGG